uniref:MHC class I-like antigen recognition-like domain-containing protein n=1 Tax=Anolis carolinensis TaxID=28377 RepID=A0A803TLD8_ANOCA
MGAGLSSGGFYREIGWSAFGRDMVLYPRMTGDYRICCSSHSMLYFVTSVSEPGQQVPQFSYVGFVNDQEFVFYNASTKRYLPKVPWISQVEKDDPDYWERNTLYAQGHERSFRDHLATLAKYYNQSGGSHQLQK